jgi:hypothetical protein
MAYWFYRGDIPSGHVVHHRCANKRCVNPKHLEAVLASRHLSDHGRERSRADRQRRQEAGVAAWSFQMLFEVVGPDLREGAE